MTYLILAFVLAAIGYMIKYKKVTWLISGYNTASKEAKEKYNVDELTKHMGNFIFILAFILFIMGILIILSPSNEYIISMIGLGIVVVYSIYGLIRLNTNKSIYK